MEFEGRNDSSRLSWLPGEFSGWLWVAVQIGLLAGFLLVPSGPHLAFLIPLQPGGAILQLTGLLLVAAAAWNLGRALTPLPSPRTAAGLKTDGAYRLMRHPIYSGGIVWAIGFALASPGLYRLLLCALLGLFFNLKARHEEELLSRQFSGYADYAHNTPRFIPRLPVRLPFRKP